SDGSAGSDRDVMHVDGRPRVMIVGGGFAGLAAAKQLSKSHAEVVLLDRQNHHLFQPLLYQVATASLSPADISKPIRATLPRKSTCQVVLTDVVDIDPDRKRVITAEGSAPYDYLVIAAGVRHDYFGHDDWEKSAPGLKTISDATEIRRRMLLAFESAEHEANEHARQAALTFVVVGGGPTGVELAGALKSIASKTLPREYRNIDTKTARVILYEGGPRLLAGFPQKLSDRAKRDLEKLGVEVELDTQVTSVDGEGVGLGDRFVFARNVIWAAGVKASPITQSLGCAVDRAGRVLVEPDLSVPGRPEIFVIGDAASVKNEGADTPVPGVAPAALQMGKYAGRAIRDEIAGKTRPKGRKPFKYVDKGSMAIIGKNKAVAAVAGRCFAGFPAWLLWALVHVVFLVGFRNRIRVLFNWALVWLLNSHDARIIVGERKLNVREPRGAGFELARPSEPAA
ncbi:MAG: NAD(P)/FAD-dependent oxidoreductase, partial [Planctomycetota bacterium]